MVEEIEEVSEQQIDISRIPSLKITSRVNRLDKLGLNKRIIVTDNLFKPLSDQPF
jgi:hypothetical protein